MTIPQARPLSARPFTVLITGFGQFPGARFNPTAALVQSLVRVRAPAFADIRRVGHVFRTSYASVDAELPELLERWRPDVVLMLGLAGRSRVVRLETTARNARSALLPDAAGVLPLGRAIEPGGAGPRRGRARFIPVLATLERARVAARLSNNAGRYLCNYAYRRALAADGPDRPACVLFLHVPRLRRLTPRRGSVAGLRRKALPTAADLLRGATAVLRALVADARRHG